MKTLARSAAIILLGALLSLLLFRGRNGPPDRRARRFGSERGGIRPRRTPAGAAPQAVVDDHWPREVSSGGDHVTMYQPQVDSWDGPSSAPTPRWR